MLETTTRTLHAGAAAEKTSLGSSLTTIIGDVQAVTVTPSADEQPSAARFLLTTSVSLSGETNAMLPKAAYEEADGTFMV